ncbi:MAG: glucose 1-dehydrogenase, partial [Tepidisphaeraceae bacterium]
VAIVTGAGSGIGESIARKYADEGAHVVVNYHVGGKHAQDAQDMVATLATESLAIGADVEKRDDMQSLIDQTVKKFGRIDIAVSNAGIEIQKPFVDVTDDEWNKVLDVNLRGAFLLSQLAARQMIKQKQGGKIIFVSSVHEDIPFVGYTAYCASKGATRMLMRNIAMELAEYQINVNNIAPGAIDTPINQKTLSDPEAKKNAISEIPWGRFGKPEEVAAVALFLASDDSAYVTGSTYYVDGGLTQQVTKY